MRVFVAPRVVGRKDTIAVLEIEFTSKARRVLVRGSDRLEPLDLSGTGPGGAYDVSSALPRVNVPLRVLRDGPGRTHLYVTVEDAAGGLATESWEGDVVLDAAPVVAENRRTAVLLATFAAVVGAIVWFVGIPLVRARNPKVPSLAGLSRAVAERSLKERGIAPVVQFIDAAADVPVGTVLAQSPAADTVVDRNATVTISVARGAVETGSLVPKLVGLTEAEASTALAGMGFRLETIESDAKPDDVGRVIRQTPTAASRAPAGARVEIVVGRAPTPSTTTRISRVPSLAGLSRSEAEAALLAAGLVPEVEVVESVEAVDGAVISQRPMKDEALPTGSTVSLRVAKAPAPVAVDVPKPPVVPSIPPVPPVPPVVVDVPKPPVEPPVVPSIPPIPPVPPVVVDVPKPPVEPPVVPSIPPVPPVPPVIVDVPKPPITAPSASTAPDVLGLDETAAVAAIRAAGLEPRSAPEEIDEGDPVGLVLRQLPRAGERSPDGLVSIFVGRHAAPAVTPAVEAPTSLAVPDVLGLRAAEATRTLEDAGFLLGAPIAEEVEAAQVGLVLSQDPPARVLAAKGSTVRLHVGALAPAVVPTTPSPPLTSAPTPPIALPPPVISTAPAPGTGAAPIAPAPPPTGPRVVARPSPTAPSVAPTSSLVWPNARSESRIVPDVTGRDAGDAIVVAIVEGFVPVIVSDRDARAAVGRVRVQSVPGGATLAAGSRLTLSVGSGYAPTMIDIPDVVGMSSELAVAELARSRIRAEVVAIRARPGVFRGDGRTVLAQAPAGRVTAQAAGLVRLYVVVP